MKLADLFHTADTLEPEEVKKMLSDNVSRVSFVDVREPAEYQQEHIPGAVLMPMSQLADRLNELDRSRPVITY